ncbi:hypothetical protein GCM10017600_71580 [Streptosporangium carneum]|uniref:WxL domain-containing protein n=2 Tax=Streptosporangium carneum TaxID=47481 RepID=A0A9W6I8K9_9ACTN|nr:hypothetical protein GCM10017600_71580 [Streptosporangium carneum]
MLAMAVVGATVGGVSGQASAARADFDSDSTVANIQVGLSITLSDLTPSFTLAGNPGETVTAGDGLPVTMRVTTNNFAGYVVTVQPAAVDLAGAVSGNLDRIASGLLEVRGPAQGDFTPLASGAPLEVARKTSRSDPGGDIITNDYRITIPFVRPDTYSGTLNYVATTL